MSHLQIPFDGTETIDTLRAENLTLKIECNKLDQEIVSLRHNLNISLTKAGAWGGAKQRITLNKPQSVVAERSWVGDIVSLAKSSSFESSSIIEALEAQVREATSQLAFVGNTQRVQA